METVDDKELLFFIELHFLIWHALEGLIKPLLEIITRPEYLRK